LDPLESQILANAAFNQKQAIGIALASHGKFGDSLGNDPVGVMVCKPKGYASHFERDTLGFGIGIELV
jgi:hypothetical protein